MLWRSVTLTILTIIVSATILPLHAMTWAQEQQIVAAVPKNFPPQFITDSSGDISGFGVDIMDRVADIAGLDIRYDAYDSWPKVFKAVKEGRADIIPNIGVTARRDAFLNFTPPVETFPIRIFVRRDTSGIHELSDLIGHSVGAMQTNVGYQLIKKNEQIDIVLADSLPDLLFTLLSGHVDAIVYPAPVISHMAESMDMANRIKAVGSPLIEIKRAIGVKKNSPRLLAQLSTAVDTLVDSKEYQQIYVKWYGDPNPFWTKPTTAAVAGAAVLSLMLFAAIWRYITLRRKTAIQMQAIEKRSHKDIKELQKNRARLAEAQSIAKIGSWECNVETGSLIWSDEIYRIFGLDPLKYKPSYESFFGLIHPEDRATVAESVIRTLETLEPYSMDHRIVLPDGTTRFIHEQGRLVHDAQSGAALLQGTAQDITVRKQTEEALRTARDEAQNANRLRDEFLANISHELRTPLNGILGMLHLLRDSGLDENQSELADIATNSGRHLVTLLSDILDISSIEAGAVSLESSDFSLHEIVKTIHEIFMDAANEKSIAFSCSLDPNIPDRLAGDGSRLRQVLFNLIGNAIKFTDSGRISVAVSRLGDTPEDSLRLLFEIADTGIGIPDEKIDTIFNPFTQADGSHTRRHGGMGLGLSIVHKLVGLMGGTISLDTEKDVGTTVRFTARFGKVAPATTITSAFECIAGSISYRVLLAEDDRVNRITATRFLEKLGHDVVAVENGWLAVEAVLNGHFDAVLMDIQMPEMNGFEATAAIRRNVSIGPKADVPIIALTAHALETDREKCLASGMTDYIAKPVEIQTLAETLNRHVHTAEHEITAEDATLH